MRPRILGLPFSRASSYILATTMICLAWGQNAHARNLISVDEELSAALASHGFTGSIEDKFKQKLERPIDEKRAELGQL